MDQVRKTVTIAVKLEAGTWKRFDGSPLPKIREGAVGDLTLDEYALVNEKERSEFIQDNRVKFLPEGMTVFVGLNPDVIGPKNTHGLVESRELGFQSQWMFAEVLLLEDLDLKMRGDKDPALTQCRCKIPALGEEAISLNHAFTMLSMHYELHRKSHTANVFDRTYIRLLDGRWQTLDEHRSSIRGRPSNTAARMRA